MGYNPKALEKLFTAKPEETEPTKETYSSMSAEQVTGALPKSVVDLPIAALEDYPKQLFKPYPQEKLNKLENSIRENGIIYPLIVRSVDGTYQIVCGHNRRTAAAQAGFDTVPCIVQEMSDDEADIRMVETNLQVRDGLFPSEKAFAYRLKYDALSHQGVASRQSGAKLRTSEYLAQEADESARQIQRYIRLTYLIMPLIDLVDNKALQLAPAVELSFLSAQNQETVYSYFFVTHKLYIDEQLAKRLREQSNIEDLTDASIATLLPKEQGKTVKQTSKFSIPTKPLIKLLDKNALAKDVEKEILDVLLEYFKKKKQGKE